MMSRHVGRVGMRLSVMRMMSWILLLLVPWCSHQRRLRKVHRRLLLHESWKGNRLGHDIATRKRGHGSCRRYSGRRCLCCLGRGRRDHDLAKDGRGDLGSLVVLGCRLAFLFAATALSKLGGMALSLHTVVVVEKVTGSRHGHLVRGGSDQSVRRGGSTMQWMCDHRLEALTLELAAFESVDRRYHVTSCNAPKYSASLNCEA